MKKVGYLAAAAASALLYTTPASAGLYIAPKANALGKTIILEPLTFVKIDDLDFGAFIIPTSGSGTVSIDPGTGTVTTASALTALPQYTPQRGRFAGAGTPGQQVSVVAVLPTKLYLNGNTASTTNLDVTLGLDVTADPVTGEYFYTIGSGKAFDVYVGGDLTIDSTMTPGTYSNVYTLTATYQ